MDILHEPLIPILRRVLAAAGLPHDGVVLDLASGSGLKLPLLHEACGPRATLLALDRDYSAIADCRLQIMKTGEPENQEPEKQYPSSPVHPFTRSPVYSLTVSPRHLVTGDAHALPLVDGCCAAACCIASWSLFADPVVVLHELRRVIVPGGPILIVSGTQAWAEVTHWPRALAEQLQAALAHAHADGLPRPFTPDVGDEIAGQFATAGLPAPQVRAFLLDTSDPAQAELAMLPWRQLRTVVAPYLGSSTLPAADEIAATSDIELCALVLAAQTTV